MMRKKLSRLIYLISILATSQHANAQNQLFTFYPSNSTMLTRQLFNVAVRIEVSGTNGGGTGTAFLVLNDQDASHTNGFGNVFLVTNRHLVQGYSKGNVTFITLKDGKPVFDRGITGFSTAWEESWFCHPSNNIDVAVLPITKLTGFTGPSDLVSN